MFRDWVARYNAGMTTTLKTCTACKTPKAQSAFSRALKLKDGLQYHCKACQKAYQQRKPVTKKRRKERILKKKFNMGMEDYERKLSEQRGCCAICSAPEPGCDREYFAVDHDHDTGMVRGLLCSRCNPGLGYFKDDPELLKAAASYLEIHRRGDLTRYIRGEFG